MDLFCRFIIARHNKKTKEFSEILSVSHALPHRGQYPQSEYGRHLQFVQAAGKNAQANCVCSGAPCAPCRLASDRMASSTAQCFQVCHCEAPKGPWQSREGSCVFADRFPTIQPGTARLPRRLCLLAMTRQVVPWCTSALLPLNSPVQGAQGAPLHPILRRFPF